jgi:hypothetical protein
LPFFFPLDAPVEAVVEVVEVDWLADEAVLVDVVETVVPVVIVDDYGLAGVLLLP